MPSVILKLILLITNSICAHLKSTQDFFFLGVSAIKMFRHIRIPGFFVIMLRPLWFTTSVLKNGTSKLKICCSQQALVVASPFWLYDKLGGLSHIERHLYTFWLAPHIPLERIKCGFFAAIVTVRYHILIPLRSFPSQLDMRSLFAFYCSILPLSLHFNRS